jgi:hypothetical protein
VCQLSRSHTSIMHFAFFVVTLRSARITNLCNCVCVVSRYRMWYKRVKYGTGR